MRRLLLLFSVLGLSACSSFSRSNRSGYAYDEDYGSGGGIPSIYQEKEASDAFDAREELGYGSRPLTDNERESVEDRVRLKRLESRLDTRREKKQYYDVRAALRSDRERINFLSIPSFEGRERWATTRGLKTADENYSDEVAKIIENKDIALGMSQKAVMQSWGDPDAVESAGNPVYGYERWKYNRYISGNDGYQKEMRIVYFEGGRVTGWERP